MVTEEVSESVMWSAHSTLPIHLPPHAITDTTPDVSHRDQLVVVARHVSPGSGEPIERLVDFSDINKKNGR